MAENSPHWHKFRQVTAASDRDAECSTCFLCCCRYLIQNLCGSHLWYWSYEEERPGGGRVAKRRVLLPAHSMQELKVRLAAELRSYEATFGMHA